MRRLILALCTFAAAHWGQAQSSKMCFLPAIAEVSGSIWVDGTLWVLADGGNAAKLYSIDTATGSIKDSTTFQNASNIDWEELSCNSSSVFIGDFGNNTGQRRNLRVFKFEKSLLGTDNVRCDTISFSYAEQTDFTNNPFTIYDCEAMIAFEDSLILFSKSWADLACRVYSLPCVKGTHKTRQLQTLQPGKLVTGACAFGNKVVLCCYGYNGQFQPGLTVLEIGTGPLFQNAKHLGLNLSNALQLESIAHLDSTSLYLTAEASNNSEATLYLHQEKTLTLRHLDESKTTALQVYPNPASEVLHLSKPFHGCAAVIYNTLGVQEFRCRDMGEGIPIGTLAAGVYIIKTETTAGIRSIQFTVTH